MLVGLHTGQHPSPSREPREQRTDIDFAWHGEEGGHRSGETARHPNKKPFDHPTTLALGHRSPGPDLYAQLLFVHYIEAIPVL
jgi:hypothetical protein